MPVDRTFVPTNVVGPIRPLHTGALFPESADVHVYELADTDVLVTLHLQVADGRPILTGLWIGPVAPNRPAREITATEIRSLPVKELVENAIRAVAVSIADATPYPYRTDLDSAGVMALRARRRRAMTNELLSEVARVVSEPVNADAPTRAVAEQLHCSYRTAGRWVAEARARGLLPRRIEGLVDEEEEK
jgi:hypothetical protein